jgi:hypothetical protein
MGPTLCFYELVLIVLVWLFLMFHYTWPHHRTQRQRAPTPLTSRRQHPREPKPFAGLTQKPPCALGE